LFHIISARETFEGSWRLFKFLSVAQRRGAEEAEAKAVASSASFFQNINHISKFSRSLKMLLHGAQSGRAW